VTGFFVSGCFRDRFDGSFEPGAGDEIVTDDSDVILKSVGSDDGVEIVAFLEGSSFRGVEFDLPLAQVGFIFEFDRNAFGYRNKVAGLGGRSCP